MNYLKEFSSWIDERHWIEFSAEFFNEMGWNCIESENSSYVVEADGKRYFLSARHNAGNGAIGTEKELDILDRIDTCNADGFIGFYSGNYSTGLYVRLKSLGVPFVLFNGARIAIYMAYARSFFVDKYFGNGERAGRIIWRYYNNKDTDKPLKPLLCVCGCGKDILEVKNISYSLVLLEQYENQLYFLYGLKSCLAQFDGNTYCGWVEINQILHPDQFASWNRLVSNYISDNPSLDLSNFHPARREFMCRLMQRMRPVNAGFFMEAMSFQ
ncbi:DUF4338 domain-containing protein [Pseudomonas sp. IT-P253]|uniref:hypothetical protein n=1 Tax=Pseudomonas sp. IT-P253 TaxID=3026455 RepID=UPI0039E0A3D2